MFTSVFAVASLAVAAFSAPVPEKRSALIVWSPQISSPSEGDVYSTGDDLKVEWNPEPPSGGEENKGRIVLAQVYTNGSYSLDYNNPLAQDFLLTEGEQTVTVPDEFFGEPLETADNYAIVLFGDSANLSGQITINGEDSTAEASGSAPASGSAAASTTY